MMLLRIHRNGRPAKIHQRRATEKGRRKSRRERLWAEERQTALILIGKQCNSGEILLDSIINKIIFRTGETDMREKINGMNEENHWIIFRA